MNVWIIRTQWNIKWRRRRETRIKDKISFHLQVTQTLKICHKKNTLICQTFFKRHIPNFYVICTSWYIDITLATSLFLKSHFYILSCFGPKAGLRRTHDNSSRDIVWHLGIVLMKHGTPRQNPWSLFTFVLFYMSHWQCLRSRARWNLAVRDTWTLREYRRS